MTATLERTEKVEVAYSQPKINRDTVRELFANGIINKTAYIALSLRLDQPIDGRLQEVDTGAYSSELSFDHVSPTGKEKSYEVSPFDVEQAIMALEKKGCLQCDKPPVQLSIGLMY